jgi:hypothetical protein
MRAYKIRSEPSRSLDTNHPPVRVLPRRRRTTLVPNGGIALPGHSLRPIASIRLSMSPAIACSPRRAPPIGGSEDGTQVCYSHSLGDEGRGEEAGVAPRWEVVDRLLHDPHRGDRPTERDAEHAARAMCATSPVRRCCLEYALSLEIQPYAVTVSTSRHLRPEAYKGRRINSVKSTTFGRVSL